MVKSFKEYLGLPTVRVGGLHSFQPMTSLSRKGTDIAPKGKGTVIVFDSRLTHEVTPITKGERYSLVKWFHGDKPLN